MPLLVCSLKMTFILFSFSLGFQGPLAAQNLLLPPQLTSSTEMLTDTQFAFDTFCFFWFLALMQNSFASIWIWGLKALAKCQRGKKTKCWKHDWPLFLLNFRAVLWTALLIIEDRKPKHFNMFLAGNQGRGKFLRCVLSVP